MNQSSTEQLKKTPLNARHRTHGARMVAFAGWDMPVEYSGIVNEHLAVRTKAGLFDVSHMGEIELAGPDALAAVQLMSTNDAAKLSIGQAQYSALTTPEGTFLDDLLVYRLAGDHYLLVVNAGNIEKDYRWIAEQAKQAGDVSVVNASCTLCIACRSGTRSGRDRPGSDLRRPGLSEVLLVYAWRGRRRAQPDLQNGLHGRGRIRTVRATGLRRTRMECNPRSRRQAAGIVPVGLGARDTLRLEAGMHLSGQDIDETTTVLEADLGWIVGWKKDNFIGKAVLEHQKTHGLNRKLVGFEMTGQGIARHGYTAHTTAGNGTVTSGTQTPFLKKAIGLAYLPIAATEIGTQFEIDVRGRRVSAQVVSSKFYKRSRS